MMNPQYNFNRMRELLLEFEISRERELAADKLAECEYWLSKCVPTQDALKRDMMAPEPGTTFEGKQHPYIGPTYKAETMPDPSTMAYDPSIAWPEAEAGKMVPKDYKFPPPIDPAPSGRRFDRGVVDEWTGPGSEREEVLQKITTPERLFANPYMTDPVLPEEERFEGVKMTQYVAPTPPEPEEVSSASDPYAGDLSGSPAEPLPPGDPE